MMRVVLVLISALLLVTVQLSYADMKECQDDFAACNDRITSVNDIEIKDAKAQCKRDLRACTMKCENDANAETAPQKEHTGKTPEEQQKNETVGETIKVYQFNQ